MYVLVLIIVLRIFMYIYSVTPKLRLACELLSADFTNYSGLRTRMNSHIKLQIVLPCKSLMAQITLKGGFFMDTFQMPYQCIFVFK